MSNSRRCRARAEAEEIKTGDKADRKALLEKAAKVGGL
jgi:hypothetical protein